jgi:hypothetical protein
MAAGRVKSFWLFLQVHDEKTGTSRRSVGAVHEKKSLFIAHPAPSKRHFLNLAVPLPAVNAPSLPLPLGLKPLPAKKYSSQSYHGQQAKSGGESAV